MSSESLADVSYFHSRKPNTETYKDFHALYGVAREGTAILLNRVVQTDESDRSTHLILVQQSNSGGFMTRVKGTQRSEYRVHYDPRGTLLATTDGETISTYHAQSVQGLYRGHINKTYRPVHERLQVNFVSYCSEEVGTLNFNLFSGRGGFSLGERALGCILSREESAMFRNEALTREITAQPGHTAVAS